MTLMEILYPQFVAPPHATVRRHFMKDDAPTKKARPPKRKRVGTPRPRPSPKRDAVKDCFTFDRWLTVKQVTAKTGVAEPYAQKQTLKLFSEGFLERQNVKFGNHNRYYEYRLKANNSQDNSCNDNERATL